MMNNVWLIGAGPMAVQYSKVLNDLGVEYNVVGRSEVGCALFLEQTKHNAIPGGLDQFLKSKPEMAECAIVAASIENLAEICEELIHYGIRNILLEKPGVGFADEIYHLSKLVSETKSHVLLAYNRRFYASTLKAQEIIAEDGGVKSFHFEFTEWSHQIRNLNKHKTELENWFLGNSTHVIDAAFFLGGEPDQISCFYKGGMDWHPKSSIYAGAGISKSGALFSYEANWEGPGRWNMDVITKKHRLVFKPMEKLQVMEIGSIAVNFIEDIDYSNDEKYKPGLYLQTKYFLKEDWSNFVTVFEQTERMDVFRKMSGY
jgi:predicted dehydrogenase